MDTPLHFRDKVTIETVAFCRRSGFKEGEDSEIGQDKASTRRYKLCWSRSSDKIESPRLVYRFVFHVDLRTMSTRRMLTLE